ncbi:MAG: 2-amino-4-hydroxy-6-hydroxymethyldihydropteridine diphosphokinase [Coprococcus sp.]|nr:2-amino-4-hydroxy-6-hydroxymethyldihydropteridine diphosphokinase [Coprococcus sp.]
MDQIKIRNLEVFGNHGVYAEERKLGQKFLVSCTLYLDTRRAGITDSLEESVDYGRVSRLIKNEMENKTYLLIEAAAENLTEEILLCDKKICQVDLEIKKPWAPIGLSLETASVVISRKWHEAYIALGSNMGDKRAYIEAAVDALRKMKDCQVERVSELIETKPYGMTEQAPFLNGALKLRTLLSPGELLERLHELEQEAKRERKIHWGPRTLDLDILLYDDVIVEEIDLCIPHVDMQNREFVLVPMVEIAPYKRHPVYGKTMTEMLTSYHKK